MVRGGLSNRVTIMACGLRPSCGWDLARQGVPLYDCLVGLKSVVLAPVFQWVCMPAFFWGFLPRSYASRQCVGLFFWQGFLWQQY